MIFLGETVGERFRPFCFYPHFFSQITKQLQRSFVPRRAGVSAEAGLCKAKRAA